MPPPDDVLEYQLQEQLAILNGEDPSTLGEGPSGTSNAAQQGSQGSLGGAGQSGGGQGSSDRGAGNLTGLEQQ